MNQSSRKRKRQSSSPSLQQRTKRAKVQSSQRNCSERASFPARVPVPISSSSQSSSSKCSVGFAVYGRQPVEKASTHSGEPMLTKFQHFRRKYKTDY